MTGADYHLARSPAKGARGSYRFRAADQGRQGFANRRHPVRKSRRRHLAERLDNRHHGWLHSRPEQRRRTWLSVASSYQSPHLFLQYEACLAGHNGGKTLALCGAKPLRWKNPDFKIPTSQPPSHGSPFPSRLRILSSQCQMADSRCQISRFPQGHDLSSHR